MTQDKPRPWTEHGKPVTRTFAKVSVASAPDPRTGAAGYATIALSPQGWQDPELVRLLGLGSTVHRAWVVHWRGGYPVREPNTDQVCKHCWRPIFAEADGTWNLYYREYAGTRQCDARSDGSVLSSDPHEPWTAARRASQGARS